MARKSSAKGIVTKEIEVPDVPDFFLSDDFPGFAIHEQEEQTIPWKCFGFKIWYNIIYIFKNPFKKPKRELNLLEQVEVLINTGDSGDVIDYCERYIYLHRIIENTRARRRLERWVTRLVSTYLLIVFALIVTSYILKWDLALGVIITILSTTTVNIVALGYILVRGLFHENENEDAKKEVPKNSKANSRNLNTKQTKL